MIRLCWIRLCRTRFGCLRPGLLRAVAWNRCRPRWPVRPGNGAAVASDELGTLRRRLARSIPTWGRLSARRRAVGPWLGRLLPGWLLTGSRWTRRLLRGWTLPGRGIGTTVPAGRGSVRRRRSVRWRRSTGRRRAPVRRAVPSVAIVVVHESTVTVVAGTAVLLEVRFTGATTDVRAGGRSRRRRRCRSERARSAGATVCRCAASSGRTPGP